MWFVRYKDGFQKENIYLLLAECEVRRQVMDRVFPFLLWPKREASGPWKQGRKNEDP